LSATTETPIVSTATASPRANRRCKWLENIRELP
jgi:hypothetical protein